MLRNDKSYERSKESDSVQELKVGSYCTSSTPAIRAILIFSSYGSQLDESDEENVDLAFSFFRTTKALQRK
ncbi:hypothetical protein Taro_032819 [Colocasia esculenta]|uniref:Uncharacterized protein n=1 Tax=Colocasia esculenta TaxID=4460 RepID=A0A843W020_COLES|nr:hypothetical protein [Colocasia esculenta]